MIKGCQHWIFLDNGLLASERVPVLKFVMSWFFGLVPWWRGEVQCETLVLGAAWGQSSLLCTHFSSSAVELSVLVEKQLSIFLNRIGPFWPGSAVTIPLFGGCLDTLGIHLGDHLGNMIREHLTLVFAGEQRREAQCGGHRRVKWQPLPALALLSCGRAVCACCSAGGFGGLEGPLWAEQESERWGLAKFRDGVTSPRLQNAVNF